jgi:prephenate dehydratase
MQSAKLVKRHEIVAQGKKRKREKVAPIASTKQALATVRSWVKQQQSEQISAYQAFAALFAEPQTKRMA